MWKPAEKIKETDRKNDEIGQKKKETSINNVETGRKYEEMGRQK